MGAVTRDQIVGLLLSWGADEDSAERIVRALERAGLRHPRMRTWLDHPQRAYSLKTEPVTIAGRETWPLCSPRYAIEDGYCDRVVEEVEAFASASPDERFLSLTFVCPLEWVRRLTRDDPERTAQLCEVARLLKDRLRKDVVIHEALQTLLVPRINEDGTLNRYTNTRLVDCMLDDRLPLVLADLRSRRLDPASLDREHDLDLYGW